MLYMLINRTRENLAAGDDGKLGQHAQGFYDRIPSGLTLHGNSAARGGYRAFALLKTDPPELSELMRSPFRRFVTMDLLAVTPLSDWRNAG